MPKNRKVTKLNGIVKVSKVSAKHRIGTRKAGVSANYMSNEKLIDIVNKNDITRDRDNAIHVLLKRGVI